MNEEPNNTQKKYEKIIKKTLDDANLSKEKKEVIAAELDEYTKELKEEYTQQDHPELLKKKRRFLEKLIQKDDDDEARDIEDIRKEEHFIISTNMKLSLSFIVIFVLWAIFEANNLTKVSEFVQDFFVTNFSWFYILSSTGFLVFLIYIGFSRFGNIVLGDPGESPEFSNISWYSMLFSAGMGIGMLFWGIAEPVKLFLHPPSGAERSVEAANMAMVYSSFHWGFHTWGIFTVCALGVAYFGFRKRKKYLLSSSLMGLSENPTVNKWIKVISDLVSTLAIVFGLAASLGFGLLQVGSGLNHVFHFENANTTIGYIIIMMIITVLFIMSATTGLKKGIKILSNLNMLVAILLMLFMFLVSEKLFIIKVFVDTLGQYINHITELSLKIAPFTKDYETWMGDWTLTYFTWVTAWSPFVGIFIARISKGRTIRELIFGSLIFPTVFTILWFSIFGGSALYLEFFTNSGIGTLVDKDLTVSLFALLEKFPLYKVTSCVSIFLIFTFLITSADSATFVISMMTTEGDLEPKIGTKVMWGVIIAIVTIILVAGGGIKAIQAAALSFAFPFTVILILIAISLMARLSRHIKSKRV